MCKFKCAKEASRNYTTIDCFLTTHKPFNHKFALSKNDNNGILDPHSQQQTQTLQFFDPVCTVRKVVSVQAYS